MKKFLKARLKLTFFYSLILLLMSIVLSTIYYRQTAEIIDIHTQRISQKWEQNFTDNNIKKGPRAHGLLVKNELEVARRMILKQIIIINGILLLIAITASYFLSGKTLLPIRKSLSSQQRFVADAAHELRTPLTALKTSIEVTLLNKKLAKTARAVLQDNLAEIQNLIGLTDNLLSLAKGESGSQRNYSNVSLPNVIKEAVAQVESLADKKQIQMKWQQTQALTADNFLVLGDRASLVKVLVIMIDNAIKYSPRHSQIKINLKRKNQQIKLEIVDQGRGISQQEQSHIFERFYRAEKARTKDGVGGYGLGLAVAKKIMEQHRGRINVDSTVGQGSCFTLSFSDLSK